ncbi:MAG: hypothetical protein O7D91_15375, partial [Planctomycetota bacterium]|nr:hypothetical protein [Planctomycetota bacterium]
GVEGNCAILTPINDGLVCDDGDPCVLSTICAAGACQGGSAPDCSTSGDDCNTASCDPDGADGNCDTLTPLADGTDCDDEDACNVGETCQGGSCTGGGPPDCSGVGDQCNVASCDANGEEGNCDIITPVKNGTQCDDGDVCTTEDACAGGQCLGGPPLECDDGNVCNGLETCDPVDGCQPGAPLDCDDGNACTDDGCDPDSGCTYDDVVCGDDDACTVDECDPELGCVYTPIECPPGQSCVDGECVEQGQQQTLIVKQGACPAPVNPTGNGIVPILLVGDFDFAAEKVVRDSLKLRLCGHPDGPYMTPLASFTRVKDINHPYAQDVECGGCMCNDDQSSDGIDDLSMKFRAREFSTVLGLTPDSAQVTLELSGVLENGTPFSARDCILIVP